MTALPKYEPPLAKRDFQNIRTTAYTHTESDHLAYGDHTALGGRLHAATGAVRRAEYTPRAIPVNGDDPADYRRASYSGPALEKFSLKETKTTKLVKTRDRDEQTADWKCRGGLVALASGNCLSPNFDRAGLSRGGLRLGSGWPQHDRPLHA